MIEIVTSEDIQEPLTVKDGKLQLLDTGWRNITDLVSLPPNANSKGTVYLRLVGNQCFLSFRGYTFGVRASVSNFLPVSICAYTHPTMERGQAMARFGDLIAADNRPVVWGMCDWLMPNSFRLVQTSDFITYGYTSWVTDTKFPSEEQIQGSIV